MSNIINVDATQSMEEGLKNYSIISNRKRAIPDARDGLKPVHKRILYSMYNDTGAIHKKKKSARIIGDVLGRYHPHGDTSAYGSMIKLATWYDTKVPLIDPQGNFGTIQGDTHAAMRYTEAKLSQYTIDCIIGDLIQDRNTVDWIPNFDNTTLEPEFLPASVPNLLINGTFGVGYGIKSEIPPHNLGEVIDATIKLIKNPKSEVILIPDHCMNVDIVDTNWKSISNKGRGSYKARGIIDIEPGPRGTTYLVIKSTPHQVKLNNVIQIIENLVETNVLQIINLNQESDENKLEYYIQLKKGVDPEYARDVIYKRTPMQSTYRVNFEVLNKYEPVRMSYKSYLQFFIDFRKETMFRLYTNRLQDASTKYHQAEAFVKVLESGYIDDIIKMVRDSDMSNDDLVEYILKKVNITDLQAEYILKSNIRNLSKNNLKRYQERAQDQLKTMEYYKDLILNEDSIEEKLINDLLEIKKKYATPRVSKIISSKSVSDIPVGDFRIIITENNHIKKMHANSGNGSFRDDRPKYIIEGCNTETILIFDQMGRVYKLPINDIKTSDPSTNGTDIRKIIKSCTSNIVAVMYEPDVVELNKSLNKSFAVVLASNGNIKKLDLSDLINVAKSGIVYMRLDSNEFIKDILITEDVNDLIIYDETKALRVNMIDIPHQRRMTKGMKSLSSDKAQGMSEIKNGSHDGLIIITQNGYINKINSVTLPVSSRNKAGTNVISLSKTDKIYSIIGDKDIKELEVYTSRDRVINIDISDMKVYSSRSKGDRLISLHRGENIIDINIIYTN